MNYLKIEPVVLTKKSTVDLHKNLADFLIDNGSNITEFNKELQTIVCNSNSIRESIVNVANHLTLNLEIKYGVKFPYFFGGGHGIYYDNKKNEYRYYEFTDDYTIWGVNPDVGQKLDNRLIQKYTHNDGTPYKYFGYDCTSIIMLIHEIVGFPLYNMNSFVMKNGYINFEEDFFSLPLGKVHVMSSNLEDLPNYKYFHKFYCKFDSKNYIGKPGDLLHMPGHIVLIIEVKDTKYICVEARGNGHGLIRTMYEISELEKNGYVSLIDVDNFLLFPKCILSKYSLIMFNNGLGYVETGETLEVCDVQKKVSY